MSAPSGSSLLTRLVLDAGADTQRDREEDRQRNALELPSQLPKNKSTGNLELAGGSSEKARIRFSFDAGAAAVEYDNITR